MDKITLDELLSKFSSEHPLIKYKSKPYYYCRFTIELRLKMSNYCDRHFNCKNAVWSVGFIVVQFFKCNLQFNKRN